MSGLSLGLGLGLTSLRGGPPPVAYGNFLTGEHRRGGVIVPESEALTIVSAAGTYFDAAGVLQTSGANELRLHYHPVTHTALGIWIERARTNLITAPSDIGNAAWTKTAMTVSADAIGDPAGGTTADKIIPTAANTTHDIRQNLTLADNTDYILSAVLPSAELTKAIVTLVTKAGGIRSRLFDLSTGADSQPSASGHTTPPGAYGFEPAGDGRVLAWIRQNSGTGGTTPSMRIYPVPDGTSVSWLGNGTSGIGIWGASVIAESSPGSILTGSRAADEPTIKATGTNNWTLTFDDGSTQAFAGVSGDLAIVAANLNRPRLRSYVARAA